VRKPHRQRRQRHVAFVAARGTTVWVEPVSYFVRMTAKSGEADRVLELLLSNPRRIEQGERGNLVFAVHRSLDDPNEFSLYETWESAAAVATHESGAAFAAYKEQLRPLVESDSVLFGNCRPIKVLGYALPQ
jgi:quinol monooxygenase YgiN